MTRAAAAIALAFALLLTACGEDPERPAAGGGSTVDRTLGDPDGDGALDVRPGEPLRDRTDVAPAGRPGEVLFTWAHLSDLHVRDEESPSRVPFLDRYGDPFDPTFRPQEALSAQVLTAAVRAVNAQRPQAVLVTGDVADNAQLNELRLARRILDGGRVDPDTGGRGYRGVQQDSNPDPFYYRPDADPPTHPRLLAEAQEPLTSPGLEAPWYGLPGNHDTLLQGELPPDPRTDGIATGTRLVTSLDPRAQLPEAATTAEAVEALLGAAAGGRSITVPADRDRRSATPAELTNVLAGGQATRVPDRLDYVVDADDEVRFVLIDLTSRTGGQEATVDPAQVAWLQQQVQTPRRVVLVTHQPPPEALLAVLDGADNAAAALHGDRHRNRITARGRYWIVGTSSLADWPMQARLFRLRRTDGDGLVLETWMVDQDGRGLAGTARELAYLDAQGGRPRGLAGARGDRNARLFVP